MLITVMNLSMNEQTRMLRRKILCEQKNPGDAYWECITGITQQYNNLVMQGAAVALPSTLYAD